MTLPKRHSSAPFCLSFRSEAESASVFALAPALSEGVGGFSPPVSLVESRGFSPGIFFRIMPLKIPSKSVVSSPSTPENLNNLRRINHLPPKNTWHSSYPPIAILKVGGKSIAECTVEPARGIRNPREPLSNNPFVFLYLTCNSSLMKTLQTNSCILMIPAILAAGGGGGRVQERMLHAIALPPNPVPCILNLGS
jgi:hypothetical protein